MPKPFMTYEEQIEKLREKQLQIPDEDSAKEALQRLSYFSLITGYKNLFKNKSTGQYRDGASFSDILFLYRFDESLRELTLHHLLHIEHHIRSLLSYSFCEIFGESQQAYLTPSNSLHQTNSGYAAAQKTTYPSKRKSISLWKAGLFFHCDQLPLSASP